MFRYWLRRALWFAPGLVLATFLVFWLISLTSLPSNKTLRADSSDQPRFINTNPSDIRSIALRAIDLARSDAGLPAARDIFTYVGGACLPIVLPQFDALDSNTRGRVAVALQPIAVRMGLYSPHEFSSPELAVVFWNRFWEERDADFHPTFVRRAVKRLARSDSQARRNVLIELDTFGLSEIMDEIGQIHTTQDIERAARLLEIAAHVTERRSCTHAKASIAQMRSCVIGWSDWWISHQSRFLSLSGPSRLTAILTETQYGKWAMQALTLELGVSPDGKTVLHRLKTQAPKSLALALGGLFISYVMAFGVGLIGAYYRRGIIDNMLGVITGLLLALPCPIFAVILAKFTHNSCIVAIALATITGALVTMPSRQLRIASVAAMNFDTVQYAHAKGLSPAHIMLVHMGKLAAPLGVTTLAVDFPLALSVVCVAEQLLGLPGIGPYFVHAVREHDVPFLMAIALVFTFIHMLLMALSEVVTSLIDPRVSRFTHQEHPWP